MVNQAKSVVAVSSAGHVSMMNDVLINELTPDLIFKTLEALLTDNKANQSVFNTSLTAQLHTDIPHFQPYETILDSPFLTSLRPDILRSSLRTLLGVSHQNATPFTSTIRSSLRSPPTTPVRPPATFFTLPGPSPELIQLLQQSRIHFASHLLPSAFVLLSSLPNVIPTLNVVLQPGPLYDKLVEAGGDMVQAAQALTESTDRSNHVKATMIMFIERLTDCRGYCLNNGSRLFPFKRAITQLIDTAHICFPDDPTVKALELPEYTTIINPRRCKKPIEKVELGTLEVPRLFFGLWQLSSPAWGSASQEDIVEGMNEMVSNGLVAADMADHYADAELLFGQYRSQIPSSSKNEPVICATKYCQFARVPAGEVIDREWVMRKVKARTDRVGGTVELLQVHWQYLDDERYLDVFNHLIVITQTNPDLIRTVGLCNFDAKTADRICSHLLKVRGEVGIVSNQVQYSLIDQRPRFAMAEVCEKYGIKLLTYGTFCGGFLSDRWVGKSEPDIYAGGLNTSQRKYLDMIKAWGGWELFQGLLTVLEEIAKRRGVDVSNVAARWVLERPETGVVIVGSRLGVTSHIPSTLRTLEFDFTQEDEADIERVIAKSRVREMFEQIGDCGNEYR